VDHTMERGNFGGWGKHAHTGFEAVNVVDKVSVIRQVTACRDNLTCLLQLQFTESVFDSGNFTIHQTMATVAEWSVCWTQEQNGPGSNRSRDAVG